MILVAIESPYAGRLGPDFAKDEARNVLYLKACIQDCLARGESPYASHEMFTRALADSDPVQRKLGIEAGMYWAAKAESRILYLDRGLSPGMILGLKEAIRLKQTVVVRGLAAWRGPLRVQALRALNGYLDKVECSVNWAGF